MMLYGELRDLVLWFGSIALMLVGYELVWRSAERRDRRRREREEIAKRLGISSRSYWHTCEWCGAVIPPDSSHTCKPTPATTIYFGKDSKDGVDSERDGER